MRVLKRAIPLICAGTTAFVSIGAASAAGGDTTLIHLDTPAVLEPGSSSGRLDIRRFRTDEELVYTSFSLNVGLDKGVEGIMRGTLASQRDFALPSGGSIRHGGNDIEFALKFRLRQDQRYAAQFGIAFPSTATQNGAAGTFGAMAEFGMAGATCFLNPRAVFLDGNTLVGIGLGARAPIGPHAQFIGEFTPIVGGDNTRSTTTGERQRRNVYGAAVRFTPIQTGGIQIDLGYTNGIGSTTGFGMTPGLGNSGAFYFAVTARR